MHVTTQRVRIVRGLALVLVEHDLPDLGARVRHVVDRVDVGLARVVRAVVAELTGLDQRPSRPPDRRLPDCSTSALQHRPGGEHLERERVDERVLGPVLLGPEVDVLLRDRVRGQQILVAAVVAVPVLRDLVGASSRRPARRAMDRPETTGIVASLPLAFHCCMNGSRNDEKNAVRIPSGFFEVIALMNGVKSSSSNSGNSSSTILPSGHELCVVLLEAVADVLAVRVVRHHQRRGLPALAGLRTSPRRAPRGTSRRTRARRSTAPGSRTTASSR